MRSIHLATGAELDEVLHLLNQAASWLTARGLDQWENGFGADRIGPMIDRGEVYLVRDDGRPVATVSVSTSGDRDFWSPAELDDAAIYISKLAIDRDHAGQGLGELLLRWTVDLAARKSMNWARLDAWRSNHRLHEFYRDAGWTHLRTVTLPHRRSGALFQHPAAADPHAHDAFAPHRSRS